MKLKDRIEELEKRVALLEQRPVYVPYPQCPPYNPNPNVPYNPYPWSVICSTKELTNEDTKH